MDMERPNRDRRGDAPGLGRAALGPALAVALAAALGAPGPAAAKCAALGGSAVCRGDVSHSEVGRRVIFPRGPAGERVGEFVVRPEGDLPQVLPRDGEAARPGPRPLDRADRLSDPTKGRDFGAFEFRSAPPAGLSSTGPLR